MRRAIFSLFLPWIVIFSITAQKRNAYPVRDIPDSLLENSVAVIRDYDETFEVKSVSNASNRVRHAVTVLSKPGEVYGVFNEFYDNDRTFRSVQATIYNGGGEIIEKVKQSDFGDYSATSDFSIYEDSRLKHFTPQVKYYPYTVEYEYVIDYNNIFNMPSWIPVAGYDVAVEKSLFRIISPSDCSIKFKKRNLNSEEKVIEEDGKVFVEWELSAYMPVESEAYSPDPLEFLPSVKTAPVDFVLDRYSGNMSTWKDFGMWQLKLLEERDMLSPTTEIMVKRLVAGIEDPVERVKVIYKFMQDRTRYVSIQEGIGGWQPMKALEVDEKGYGDCKALTNYTRALLKSVGIVSHYTKVRADRHPRDIDEEFVSNQTNHVFLCVPVNGDTIWLECTSQTAPFGYIGNFTHDRKVMIITDDGGMIVRSKGYGQEENLQVTRAIVELKADNSCRVDITTTCTGLQYDNISGRLNRSEEENRRWLYGYHNLSNFEIGSFEFSRIQDKPVAKLHEEIVIKEYLSGSGKRAFIDLNMFNKKSTLPEKRDERKNELELRYPFIDIDSITFVLPVGYQIESIPEAIEITNEFGEYRASVEVEQDEVLYRREWRMNAGRFPAGSYSKFRQFHEEIVRADRAKLVLLKPER